MIHYISIENFFSIADKQELFFEIPEKAPDLACFRTGPSSGNARLPVVVGFFGANASGKSTILRAVVAAAIFCCGSFAWAQGQINLLFQPYRQKDWWDKPTRIMIEFDASITPESPTVIFRYELHLAHEANNFSNKFVLYESLSYAPKKRFCRLFERNFQKFQFSEEFNISANDPRQESIRANASVISTLAQFNHKICQHIIKHIGTTFETNIIGFNRIQQSPGEWLSKYAQNKLCLDQLNRELRRLDVGLESMSIEKGNQGLYAKFKHIGLDEFIILEEESRGTQRFIEFFPLIHHALQIGSVAIIDELDNDLHPLLVPEILRWFTDPKKNIHGAQLFFTAHNPALLDDMEKEQIFFTTKLSGHATEVYGARDIKGLRREPSLMKKYLSGELGAIPHIG